jgi:hypothetical protein
MTSRVPLRHLLWFDCGAALVAGLAVLITANAGWTLVCGGLAVALAGPGRWLGVAFYLGEGLFVAALAAIEASASRVP